mgnify:CR=1 FL=1
MKRAMDIVLAMAALLALAPLLLGAALAIALETGLPVLFRQTRVGLNGREFGMYKFRSMVKNAAQVGPYFTTDNDPRITRVGRFVRRTSIDELPQLINVLKGEMSLVGPRPDVPAQRSLYTAPKTIRGRITAYFSVLARQNGSLRFTLPFDRQQLADHLGVDRSALSNALSQMQREGLLVIDKREVELKQVEEM